MMMHHPTEEEEEEKEGVPSKDVWSNSRVSLLQASQSMHELLTRRAWPAPLGAISNRLNSLVLFPDWLPPWGLDGKVLKKKLDDNGEDNLFSRLQVEMLFNWGESFLEERMEESDAKGERGDHFFGLRQVVEFAKTIFDSILKRFRALQITNASAKIVPPCIWKMTRLKSLSLEGNRITEISPSVQNLKVLRILNLRGNELQKLPGSIGKMAQLEVLNVGGNQLQSLPEEIFMLRNLRVLDVSSNELATLPKGLQELSDLKEVYLNNNINLEEIPVCFLFRCKDISSYRVQRSIAKALNKNYLCDENHSVSILL
mmetsp:Transcript_16535/g.26395  ORF Transcript_16535/g.26395 Transcript_16535/m.26395 type:complete len:314 (+) Transcript_16535:137-1078(+)